MVRHLLCIFIVFYITNVRGQNDLQEVLDTMSKLDKRHGELHTESTIAEWNYNTNLTDHNSEVSTNKSKILEDFEAEAFKIVSNFDKNLIEGNYDLERQIKKVKVRKMSIFVIKF